MTAGFLGEVREAALRLPAAVRLPQTFTSRYLPGEPEPERETWIAAYDREADEFRLFLTRDARRGRFTDESVLAYRDFAAAVNRRKISGKMISAWLFPHGLDGFRAAHPGCGIGIIDELGKTRHRQMAYLESSQLEQMVKGGFAGTVYRDCAEGRIFSSVCSLRPGSDIRRITGLPDYAWRAAAGRIRSLDDLVWLRAIVHDFNPGSEALKRLLALDLGRSRSDLMRVLRQSWDGQPLYTMSSLLDYLEHIRLRQGLEPETALTLLKDYNDACLRLGAEPVVKSANLERDHDFMSRLYSKLTEEERVKALRASFKRRAGELKDLEYTDGRLSVVIPQSPKDLYEEGRNNHNCVASYAEAHAAGKTSVLFIRKTEKPEESYITVELDTNRHTVRQAFYGHNRRIDTEDSRFIDAWLEKAGSK